MTSVISLIALSRRYRDQFALDDVDLQIDGPSITGLLGRNGAGKTTLLRIIAAQEFASSGRVAVLGADPVENEAILPRIAFVREDQSFPAFRVRHALRAASWFFPDWSAELAQALVADFGLPLNQWVPKLSRGMRSALSAVIGLAARAEVTLFDEPYAGLDAVARRVFYDRLLADYTEHPRTVVLSTHLIDEASGLLERVVVLDRGRIVLDAGADEVRGVFTRVSGAVEAVEEFVAGRAVLERRRVASQESAVVAGRVHDGDAPWARELRLTLEPLSLQQVMVQATGRVDEQSTESERA
jgi:ABC-2 type transport system ATP-binding protein